MSIEDVDTDADDRVLARQASKGDEAAFSVLIDRHYHRIFAISYQWCGNKEQSEDMTQEVCIKLAKAIHTFRGDAKFTTWLYRMTLNTARDAYRKKQTRKAYEEQWADYAPHEAAPEQERIVLYQSLQRCIDKLPESEKEAVLLVYTQELNHAEAADISECKESTISWRVHEAKKKLADCLGEI